MPHAIENLYRLTLVLLLLFIPYEALAKQLNGAAILSYHEIGRPLSSETNIAYQLFENHIQTLRHDKHNLISLKTLEKHLKNKTPFPQNTAAITFHGGYKSPLSRALPLLIKHKIPTTIFIAPETIGWNSPHFLTWKDIKSLSKNKYITFGLHAATYTHQLNPQKQHLAATTNRAITKFRDNLGHDANYFAYPFGEVSNEYIEIIKKADFKLALGQQSGRTTHHNNPHILPAFTMSNTHGSAERFNMKLNTIPMITNDHEPTDPRLATRTPAIGFSIHNLTSAQIEKLNCFGSGYGKLPHDTLGNRIEIRLPHQIEEDRFRLNCTIAATETTDDGDTKWYWHGQLFTVPQTLPYQ